MSDKCKVCDGDGFILSESREYGLRIERCDACGKYGTDERAVQVAYKKAKRKIKKVKKFNIVNIANHLSEIKYGYRGKI